MRKIEQEMVAAVKSGRGWMSTNTSVLNSANGIEVYLLGNRIAYTENSELVVDKSTLKRWPTVTTKSRLRALGFNVYTKNKVIYLNDEPITE